MPLLTTVETGFVLVWILWGLLGTFTLAFGITFGILSITLFTTFLTSFSFGVGGCTNFHCNRHGLQDTVSPSYLQQFSLDSFIRIETCGILDDVLSLIGPEPLELLYPKVFRHLI